MPTLIEVEEWIQTNVLDTTEWDKSQRKEVAVIQAERNLTRWYPEAELLVEHIALQSIWEVEGLNPALKFQKHGVQSVSDSGEGITYKAERSKAHPEIIDALGEPFDGYSAPLEGGVLY
ncbi:hypothetical protein [Schinkia azotoformans]|uniref:hypothetical protein n=1 Tax=Schinkia azotoformans TaxID=1454 RepID=UPI002DBA0841|nr:hypothetical protein [Schinkia azotoformans]MEC1714758.1 hypothetical protein [Schinkia azotoformans]MEC1757486.1 hypothetical protein [Schinkia azotoformans]